MRRSETFLQITITTPHFTSVRKAGTTNVYLPHNRKVMILGNLLAPDHDRALFDCVVQQAAETKPHLIIVLGRSVRQRRPYDTPSPAGSRRASATRALRARAGRRPGTSPRSGPGERP